MKFAAILASTVLLCAAVPANASISFDLKKLERATQADLAAAKADADAHNDVFASECYAGVSDFITTHPLSAQVPEIKGVASAFQAGRDVVKGVEAAGAQGALPPELVEACGPLALDVQNDIGKAAAGGFSFFGLKF